MKQYVYAFKDLKANCFRAISCDLTIPEGMAELFSRSLRAPDANLGQFDGLQLVCLGTFDDVTGVIVPFKSYSIVVDCDVEIEALKNGKVVKAD